MRCMCTQPFGRMNRDPWILLGLFAPVLVASVVRVRDRMFSLADLFVSGLLFVNGAAVLNEERFLVRVGWGYEQSRSEPQSIKKQIINMLHAVRLLFTIPLMALNVIVIFLKLIVG